MTYCLWFHLNLVPTHLLVEHSYHTGYVINSPVAEQLVWCLYYSVPVEREYRLINNIHE